MYTLAPTHMPFKDRSNSEPAPHPHRTCQVVQTVQIVQIVNFVYREEKYSTRRTRRNHATPQEKYSTHRTRRNHATPQEKAEESNVPKTARTAPLYIHNTYRIGTDSRASAAPLSRPKYRPLQVHLACNPTIVFVEDLHHHQGRFHLLLSCNPRRAGAAWRCPFHL